MQQQTKPSNQDMHPPRSNTTSWREVLLGLLGSILPLFGELVTLKRRPLSITRRVFLVTVAGLDTAFRILVVILIVDAGQAAGVEQDAIGILIAFGLAGVLVGGMLVFALIRWAIRGRTPPAVRDVSSSQ